MSCSCDLDYPSCYTERYRRARLRHQCYECCGAIDPGDRYLHISGVWDDRPDSFKMHLTCKALRDELAKRIDCDCIPFGNMNEYLAEYCHEHLGYWP